jgi:hypothetical protein
VRKFVNEGTLAFYHHYVVNSSSGAYLASHLKGNAEVKNSWSFASTSPYVIMGLYVDTVAALPLPQTSVFLIHNFDITFKILPE